ncbi:MAG: 23S rRNA (uracil(1939)-C(5))-methyltransferase RlmD [Prevotellaceae bacterium]|jgi:23S rRNA (uracil1939-C5)-methyltransferase|nr:23S rRNA (uracil(1939)-C(5))-methyltransferase RlmD [Prevotellaceae bacterium]
MARKHKPLPLITNITITDVAAEGKAIAKFDGMALFTAYAVPGDVVDVQITKKKSRFLEGRVVRFHSYSPVRTAPACEHFGICGGCKWQNLPYEEQLRYKEKQVADTLQRLGKIALPPVMPILGSEKRLFYRNKLEYTFSNKRWMTCEEIASGKQFDTMNVVGFHIPGMFDKVLDIQRCWLQEDISNHIRNAVRRYALEHQLTFFDLRQQAGFLRTLMIRTTSIGELMVVTVFFYEDKPAREALLGFLAETFPEITSLLYVINQKCNDTIADQEIHRFHGTEAIYEEIEGLRFKIGAKSFFQTNSEQACELYKVVRTFADLSGNELVYDLYTGAGSIALFVARQAREVIGIEYVPEAIADAHINAQLNGVTNVSFLAGDMKDVLTEAFIAAHGRPDVIITDPPRAGMHADVIKAILFAAPQKIVYVSCNPATQARDVALMDEFYTVKRVQPVDMFPHTHHVENVILLERRTPMIND